MRKRVQRGGRIGEKGREGEDRLVINVPDVYMARYEVILMRETSISRDIRRDGP